MDEDRSFEDFHRPLCAELCDEMMAHQKAEQNVQWTAEQVQQMRVLQGPYQGMAQQAMQAHINRIKPNQGEVENLRAELAQRAAERDGALAERDRWLEHTKFVMRDRIAIRVELDAARAELATAMTIIENDTRLIAEQAAEIAALRAAAAKAVPPVPLGNRPHASDCAVHNEPAFSRARCDCGAMHNPFQEFAGDRRRIGV